MMTFFNYGNSYTFRPTKTTVDRRDNRRVSLARFHAEIVVERDDPLVYMMDHKGENIDPNTILKGDWE